MREVETAEQAKQFDCEIGSTLYLIEFGDGWSTEITQNYVEAVGDEE